MHLMTLEMLVSTNTLQYIDITYIFTQLSFSLKCRFLAPIRRLYELLCHRKGRGKGREKGRERAQQNECFCNNLDPAHLIWTKFGMDILLDPRNKPAEEIFIFLKIHDAFQVLLYAVGILFINEQDASGI